MDENIAEALDVPTHQSFNRRNENLTDNLEPRDDNIYYSEFERLKSFPLQWNGYFPKDELAKSGFYFVRLSSRCICVCCHLEIEAVQVIMSLPDLHLSKSPNCDFANNRFESNIPLKNVNNYRFERNRLVSFLKTNWCAPVNPYELAKFGFYWTGTTDVGRCAFCRLEVRGWEQGDAGRSEHLRWNPHCAFIQDREVGNIPLGEETDDNMQTDQAVQGVNHNVLGPRPSASEFGVVPIDHPKHPEYANLQTRQNSFQIWPLSIAQRPKELADSGFYYTGRGDRVVCFHCGGGLKDWGPKDDPWVEHAKWFSSCPYLVMKMGVQFMGKVLILKAARSQSPDSNSTNQLAINRVDDNINDVNNSVLVIPVSQAVEPSAQRGTSDDIPQVDIHVQDPNNGVEGDGDENALDTRRACKVCFVRELGVVFLPCGHMATCTHCAPQLPTCPICRRVTSAYVRAYLP